MSRNFLINSLVALFSAVVMLLGIKLAAAAESATVDTPTQTPCQFVEFENSLASYHSALDGKNPISATLVSANRMEDAEVGLQLRLRNRKIP